MLDCEKLRHQIVSTFTVMSHTLVEQKSHLTSIENILRGIRHDRQKRSLLGQLLTSVFVVNDEVYKGIDELEKNQQVVIKSSNHQTKRLINNQQYGG